MNKRISHPESFAVAIGGTATAVKTAATSGRLFLKAGKVCILEKRKTKLLSFISVTSSVQQDLQVSITFCPFSSKKREIIRKKVDLEEFVKNSLKCCLRIKEKNLVQVDVQVLEFDTITTLKQDLVNISCLSLANHGIEMNDLVVSTTVGLAGGMVVDLSGLDIDIDYNHSTLESSINSTNNHHANANANTINSTNNHNTSYTLDGTKTKLTQVQ
jgi:ribonuclease PH